jgi:hypothetical protein
VSTRNGAIAVAGAIAQRPGRGGHAWVFLQYLLGLRRLGWDVLFLDRIDGTMTADPAYVEQVMGRFEIPFSVLAAGGQAAGMPVAEVERRLRSCELLLNFMGYMNDERLLALPRRRVFVDIDPGFPQMWQELGLARMVAGHDAYVTVGENIGAPGCAIPTCGVRWVTTAPPVVLSYWPWADLAASAITGIGTWRGAFGPVCYGGLAYGLRAHEFRQFANVPRLVGAPRFEYALEIDPIETKDIKLLTEGGWNLLDPAATAATVERYRDFIQGSMAEFMVAKGMYVKSRSGWFSDRSVCYLASGRPVIAQDTGRVERPSAGLLTFATADEAVTAVERVLADYPRQRRAAREVAEAAFDSDRVLARLVEKVTAGA